MELLILTFGFIALVVLFRVALSKFCDFVDLKKKLFCVAGMILGYTGMLIVIIMSMAFVTGIFTKASDFAIYMSVVIGAFNIVVGAYVIIICATAKRRTLSNREKIMLRDM